MWEYIVPIVTFLLGLFASKRLLKFMYEVVSGMRRVYSAVEHAQEILGSLIVLLNTITKAIEDGKVTEDEIKQLVKDVEKLEEAIKKLKEAVNEYGGHGRSDKGQP